MFEATLEIRVEWGHCDPAQIVFNPNYFHWMESGLHWLFEAAGLSLTGLMEQDPDFRGAPLVRSDATFKAVARVGDLMSLTTRVVRWGGRSFDLGFRFAVDGTVVVEATQTRIWGRAVPGEAHRLQAVAIPDRIRDALSRPGRAVLRRAG